MIQDSATSDLSEIIAFRVDEDAEVGDVLDALAVVLIGMGEHENPAAEAAH